jgi:hypothetical protein
MTPIKPGSRRQIPCSEETSMLSMPPSYGADALAARIAALEAERLAPVPRASHAIGIDVDDLALILHHLRAATTTPKNQAPPAISGDTAAAWQRLEAAVRGHASPATRSAAGAAQPRSAPPTKHAPEPTIHQRTDGGIPHVDLRHS